MASSSLFLLERIRARAVGREITEEIAPPLPDTHLSVHSMPSPANSSITAEASSMIGRISADSLSPTAACTSPRRILAFIPSVYRTHYIKKGVNHAIDRNGAYRAFRGWRHLSRSAGATT